MQSKCLCIVEQGYQLNEPKCHIVPNVPKFLFIFFVFKGREPITAAALASKPAASHNLSFIISIVFMTLAWGLLVGLAAESCGRIWLPCLIGSEVPYVALTPPFEEAWLKICYDFKSILEVG